MGAPYIYDISSLKVNNLNIFLIILPFDAKNNELLIASLNKIIHMFIVRN